MSQTKRNLAISSDELSARISAIHEQFEEYKNNTTTDLRDKLESQGESKEFIDHEIALLVAGLSSLRNAGQSFEVGKHIGYKISQEEK